jgi:(2Fe-2S) ferredoxin
MKYPFQRLFLVCTGKRCNDEKHGANRGELLRERLKDHNRDLGRKPVVRICAVSCLDLCDYGPNMVVHPAGTTYGGVTQENARVIYDGECGDGPARPDLELEL